MSRDESHRSLQVNKRTPNLFNTFVIRAGIASLVLYIGFIACYADFDAVTGVGRTVFSSVLNSLFALGVGGEAKHQAESQAVPYREYVLAPASRTIHPVAVHQVNGTVVDAENLVTGHPGSAQFHGYSAVTLDYGKNIAGVVSLSIGNASSQTQAIGITFSESSLWISGLGSDGTAESGIDEVLWIQPSSPGVYTTSREHERGAFRYLSLIHNSTGTLEVNEATTYFTAMPHYREDQLQDYTGYFHCDDELLNRIWYAGAYTNQLCTIDAHHGDSMVHLDTITHSMPGDTVPPQTWYNNFTITNGSSALVDGAKRDRLVFSADLLMALPGIVTSTSDLITIKSSLDSLFALQDSTTGQLPYVGAGYPLMYSVTYHLYSIILLADYYLYSGDLEYVRGLWGQTRLALRHPLQAIDETGLMHVDSPHDWLRFGMGGHNIEANAILHHTLCKAVELATALNDTKEVKTWQAQAAAIKAAANALLWDAEQGMYRDNETTSLAPQDGNVWAVLSNLTQSQAQVESISSGLAARWTPYGAPAPEAGDAICPFVSGLELRVHMIAGSVSRTLSLMRKMWGYMLEAPGMTGSTFIEGYAVDGSLHYAPYSNDPKVSHAHAWASGPTSALSFYIAGITLDGPAGNKWKIEPRLGDLKRVEAGFKTELGKFKVDARQGYGTERMNIIFQTPKETVGSVSLEHPGCQGRVQVRSAGGSEGVSRRIRKSDVGERIQVNGLQGGEWNVVVSCDEREL